MNGGMETRIEKLDRELTEATYDPEFHGDMLLGDPVQKVTGYWNDISRVLSPKNFGQIGTLAYKAFTDQGLDVSTRSRIYALVWTRAPFLSNIHSTNRALSLSGPCRRMEKRE